MLLMTYELLRDRADIRRACQERWQWILVDEFQDINRLQYEIVRMIAGERKNLTIVGDDDQSIYRFRGAKPEIMLGFERDYPGAKKVLLDINFRSTPEIVDTAGRLIRHNRRRFEKKIRASRPSGKPVNTVVCPDPAKEAAYIAREIKARVLGIGAEEISGKPGAEDTPRLHYGDIAILYRTNLQPRLLAAKLMAEGIPFRMKEMLPDLMDHWIAKDVQAYLRLARSIGDRADLVRIMNRPNRYIRRDAVREEAAFHDGAPDFAVIARWYFREGQGWMKDRLDRFAMELRALSRRNVGDAIRYLREEIGYDEFLKSYAEEHRIELSELMEIIDEITDSAEGFQFPEDWFEHCREFREELLKKKESRRKSTGKQNTGNPDAGNRGEEQESEDTDQVHLMTFHASKGLEFPLVYLVDVNEGIVPHRKAGTRDELEEERRMFYVAMTRAKDELQICTCRKRFKRAAEESPFISEYERG
jgi:DNA helicase-2/ATP-dependent DNA helicase PcrA